MTPITVDSVPECQSLYSKVNKSKQILPKNLLLRSKGRSVDPSIENQVFLVDLQLKILLLVSLLQTWLKFHRSNHFGGTPGCIQMPVQASTTDRNHLKIVSTRNDDNLTFTVSYKPCKYSIAK